MEKSELLWIATWAFYKGYDYEKTKYSDYLYGKESEIDNVWYYYNELEDIGTNAFYEKYKDFKLFGK